MITKEQYLNGCELWRVRYDYKAFLSSYNGDPRTDRGWETARRIGEDTFFTSKEDVELYVLEHKLRLLND